MLGAFVLSSGYYEAYYAKAQKVRRLITQKTEALLKDYDLLLSPTTPSSAFKLGSKTDDPIQMYLEDIFTVHANLVGTPAISLPLGIHPEAQMPFGIQFMAARFNEKLLLGFSNWMMNNQRAEISV